MQTHVGKQLEIHFMYLGNEDIYCILKTWPYSVLFYTTCHLFHNFIFFHSNNTHIFINCELKSEYLSG